MNFDQTNEMKNESTASPAEPQGDGEFFDEAELGGGSGKSQQSSMMILGGLLVVAAGVIWFMFFRGTPQAATAAAVPSGGPDIKRFLDSDNINLMKQTLKDTEKVVQQFRSYPAQTQVPLSALKSNPFRELAPKSDNAPVARNNDDEAKEHAKVVTAVSDLHLQSVMRGGKYKSCMINNSLYSEGQQVGMFTLQQVGANSVVLECGKYRFELKMQN